MKDEFIKNWYLAGGNWDMGKCADYWLSLIKEHFVSKEELKYLGDYRGEKMYGYLTTKKYCEWMQGQMNMMEKEKLELEQKLFTKS